MSDKQCRRRLDNVLFPIWYTSSIVETGVHASQTGVLALTNLRCTTHTE